MTESVWTVRNTVFSIVAILTSGLGMIWLAWYLNGYPVLGIDDANIFFVYAENLLRGNGLTYGAQGECVEGFSSPLWLGICVVVKVFCFRVEWVHMVNLLGYLFTLCICFRITHLLQTKPDLGSWQAVMPSLALVCFPSFVIWFGLTGMDVGIWVLLLTGFIFDLLGQQILVRKKRCLVWMLLLTLTRSEAFVVVPALVAGHIFFHTDGDNRDDWKDWFAPVLGWFVGVGILFLVRHQVYGIWLPNTYYAKVPPDLGYRLNEGYRYLESYFLLQPFASVLTWMAGLRLILWTVERLRNGRTSRKQADKAFLAFVGIVLLLVPVLSGGDHFRMHRLLQPALPFLLINIWLMIQDGIQRMGAYRLQGFVGFVSLLILLIYPYGGWRDLLTRKTSPLRMEFDLASTYYKTGLSLSQVLENVQKKPTLGVVLAGAVARTYQGPVVDLMGLNNAVIGQAPGDRKGIRNHSAFRRHYLESEGVKILLANPNHLFMQTALKDIFVQPGFYQKWRYGILIYEEKDLQTPELFVRKDVLESLVLKNEITFKDTLVWQAGVWGLDQSKSD